MPLNDAERGRCVDLSFFAWDLVRPARSSSVGGHGARRSVWSAFSFYGIFMPFPS